MSGIEKLKVEREEKLDLIAEYQKRSNLSDAEKREKNAIIMQVFELDQMLEELSK